MDFFQQISNLNINGDVIVTIKRSSPEKLFVVVQTTNADASKDGLQIPAIKFDAAPLDLDESFFGQLSQAAPIINTTIDDFQAQIEANKAKALANKPQGSSVNSTAKTALPPALQKPSEEKVKYDKLVTECKDVDKLIADKKYSDAVKKLNSMLKVYTESQYTDYLLQLRTKAMDAISGVASVFSSKELPFPKMIKPERAKKEPAMVTTTDDSDDTEEDSQELEEEIEE